MLEDDETPWVHSVSYGLQVSRACGPARRPHGPPGGSHAAPPAPPGRKANISDAASMGCTKAAVDAVDADFAKLAAKGVSIIIASGDSGSGYAPTFCEDSLQVGRRCAMWQAPAVRPQPARAA